MPSGGGSRTTLVQLPLLEASGTVAGGRPSGPTPAGSMVTVTTATVGPSRSSPHVVRRATTLATPAEAESVRSAKRAWSSAACETTLGDYYTRIEEQKQKQQGSQPRAVERFYDEQDRLLDSFEEADKLITRHRSQAELSEPASAAATAGGDAAAERALACVDDNDHDWRVGAVTNLSLATNVVLLVMKVIVLASTGSLAVLGSVVDSALDLFSCTVIFLTNRYMSQRNRYLFPMGKKRFEPLATIIIASVMATAAIEIVSKAIQALANDDPAPVLGPVDLGLLGATVAIKIVLHLICRTVPGPSARALAMDHRNDCVSNATAMLTAWLGATYWDAADPLGAILIGMFIITTWYLEGREHVLNLAGRGAPPQFIQQLTWVAMHHDPRVQLVDTVRAIHFGCGFLVEVDIVLPPEMPLHEAHDIGEELQHKLELLPMCDRAHVHLDFECDHGPEDEHKRL